MRLCARWEEGGSDNVFLISLLKEKLVSTTGATAVKHLSKETVCQPTILTSVESVSFVKVSRNSFTCHHPLLDTNS